MDFTCGLGDKLWDMTVELLWEQLRYLPCYDQNIEQLSQQYKKLKLRRSFIKHQVNEATNNAEEIEDEVLDWFNDVDEILEQVDKFRKEESAIPWLRYKLGKLAKEMADKVADTCGNGNFFRVSYRLPPKPLYRESDEEIDSRVLIVNQLLEVLQNPSFDMVGLCGLGGVGKTTVAKELEKQAGNQKIFGKVIMATVSVELNIWKIQSQIAEKLDKRLHGETEEARASHLHKELEGEESMLLILDDLWDELYWYKVGIPVKIGAKKIKVPKFCKLRIFICTKMEILRKLKVAKFY